MRPKTLNAYCDRSWPKLPFVLFAPKTDPPVVSSRMGIHILGAIKIYGPIDVSAQDDDSEISIGTDIFDYPFGIFRIYDKRSFVFDIKRYVFPDNLIHKLIPIQSTDLRTAL